MTGTCNGAAPLIALELYPMGSGAYFYHLTVGKRTLTKKMVLLKSSRFHMV